MIAVRLGTDRMKRKILFPAAAACWLGDDSSGSMYMRALVVGVGSWWWASKWLEIMGFQHVRLTEIENLHVRADVDRNRNYLRSFLLLNLHVRVVFIEST